MHSFQSTDWEDFLFFLSLIVGSYLGQNFLTDTKVRHRIADKVKNLYQQWNVEAIIEIWPGKGAITKLIKGISPNFTVIEKDETLKTGLEEILADQKATLVIDDVLNIDLQSLLTPSLIVGNLPYYITSPILRKFFSHEHPNILGGLFMIQMEVGEKIKRDAGKKSYLYRLLNYAYRVDYLKTIPAKAFSPAPKVKSCLVSLVKKSELPQLSFERLVEFLDFFSPYSRKTLGKIAKMVEKKEKHFSIPEVLQWKRLEELSRSDLELILK